LFWRKKKTPPVKKSFEEKLDDLSDQIRRDDEHLRRVLHTGHQPVRKKERVTVTVEPPKKRYQTKPTPMPERKNFNGQPRRGMTVNHASSSRAQTDDLMLAVMMQQTYVAPTPSRSHDDNCRVDHTPSYRHSDPDPSPSYEGGSDSGYSGGGSCD